jgi:acyl carrier protein
MIYTSTQFEKYEFFLRALRRFERVTTEAQMSDQNQTEAVKFRSEEELRKVVRGIVIELAPNPAGQSSETSRLVDDLGYHSLALLELAFALEDEFDLTPIDEPTARTIVTIKDIENHVARELKTAGRIE